MVKYLNCNMLYSRYTWPVSRVQALKTQGKQEC